MSSSRAKFVWMFGQKLDLAFFFLPVILAPLIFLLSQLDTFAKTALWGLIVLNAFGLGDFHVGITWFNYFDRKNWNYYSNSVTRRMTYLFAPSAIVILTVVGMFLCPGLVFLVYVCWSIQHLVQQNVGLLLLYHNHGQNEAIVPRTLEVRTLHLAAIFYSLLFAQRILFTQVASSPVWKAVVIGIGIAFALAVVLYLKELIQQVCNGAYLNASAFLFWCLSMYFFVPFAFFGKSYSDAILIANIMHWAQYVGIMYVLVRRKYRNEQLSNLAWRYPIALFCILGLSMVALLDISRALPLTIIHNCPTLATSALGFVLGMGMVHYFQDAFMWRFREPYYRETVLSYLRLKS